jgi:hypothetical protein
LRDAEITSHYEHHNLNNTSEAQTDVEDTFVLNINYAGNDGLESMVRIKLRERQNEADGRAADEGGGRGLLKTLVEAQKQISKESNAWLQQFYVPPICMAKNSSQAQTKPTEAKAQVQDTPTAIPSAEQETVTPPPCLFYYGYLVWIKI